MSYIGKRVTFKLVDGGALSGYVTNVLQSPWDETEVWYELDTGWTVRERNVVAAKWEEA